MKQKVAAAIAIFFGLVMVVTCAAVENADAHSKAITECRGNIIYTEAKLIEEWVQEGTGFWAEGYDTNSDGQVDIVALSHIIGIDKRGERIYAVEHRENPVFWMVDRREIDLGGDGIVDEIQMDGVPDYIYVDKIGEGKCEDIVLYEDLTPPRADDSQALGKGKQVL